MFAEIVHINQARIGNISRRPTLRKYEIPILTQASVDEEHTIPLQDLFVSVHQNRIVLSSGKLNKEVIPRLSSAHNYAQQTLPVYHFLCDLQFQGVQGQINWKWGALHQAPYLPRVCYDKVILSLAQWLLGEEEIQLMASAKGEQLYQQVQEIRKVRSIPRWIIVAEEYNKLPLDLENTYCLLVLQSLAKAKKSMAIEECIADETTLWTEGPEGLFTNEFIIPFQYTPPVKSTLPPVIKTPSTQQRQFTIGSEWLYAKIYCGIKTADKLLTEVFKPLTERLVEAGVIDKWFFIRYQDPDHHLRVRFHGEGIFYAGVIEQLHQELQLYLDTHLIHKIQLDTYQRELERYGLDNIVNSETLFFHDSVAVVGILDRLSGTAGDESRWQLAIRGVDGLLGDFGYSLIAKETLMAALQERFGKEFNLMNRDAKQSLRKKFRQERKKIESILQSSIPQDHELFFPAQVLEERSKHWQPIITQILQEHREGRLSIPLASLLGSYIHMFLNRFLRSRQRMHEAIIYNFLFHTYHSSRMQAKPPFSK